ncbi:MAG: hypothetical protein ACYS1A_10185 [Planctomycetota bacterium]|jgi:hypothetical protein
MISQTGFTLSRRFAQIYALAGLLRLTSYMKGSFMDKATKLLKLAKEKFGETLTEAEIKLFDKVVIAELADYSIDEERNLRAVVIEWLCSDKKATALVTHRGICLKGANIDDLVNLAYLNIQFPLHFEKCNIPKQIELHSAKLRELYMGGSHIGSLSGYGMKIEGHVFLRDDFTANGEVDFTGATIEGDFDCSNGHFIHPNGSAINLSRARVRNNVLFTNGFKSKGVVVMIDSHIEGNLLCNGGEFINSSERKMAINASRLRCGGDVSFKGGFRAEGEVTFSGGIVGGNFDCFDSEFCNHSGDALNAEALNVGGGIFLMGNFKGEVRLLGATVGQSLECHGGDFDNPNGYTINADSANIDGNIFLRNAFKSNGEVNLIGAKIGGDIDCEKGHFVNPEGIAFHGDQIEVRGSIFLRHGFMAEGIVSLTGGKIKNNLDCEYGQFTNKVGPAILADGLNMGGSVLLCSRYSDDQANDNMPKRFKAEGGVSFKRAVIGGDFACQGSLLINRSGYAFICSGIKVNNNVYLCNSSKTVKQKEETSTSCQVFRAEGQVDFSNARIYGNFCCNGGKFINRGEDTSVDKGENVVLNLDCIKVDDSIMLNDNFHAEGQVSLLGAEIGGQLNCIAGQFLNPGGVAFVAECARVGGNVFLCGSDFQDSQSNENISEKKIGIDGRVLLSGAEIKGSFVWCKVASPEKVSLDLRFSKIGSLWDEKKSWPEKDKLLLHGFIYNEISDKAPRDARTRKEWLSRQSNFMPQPYEQLAKVLKEGGYESNAKEILIAKEKAKSKELKWYEWLPHVLYGLLVGYGYRPWRAFLIGLIVIVVGGFLFSAGFQAASMTPVKNSDNHPEFHAFVYSLDVFLPVIDLHQANYWLPDSMKDFKLNISEKISINVSGKTLWYYVWIEIAAGWVLTTLLVVSLTGLIRR